MTEDYEHYKLVAALILSIIVLICTSWYLGTVSSEEEITNLRSGVACILAVYAALLLYHMCTGTSSNAD